MVVANEPPLLSVNDLTGPTYEAAKPGKGARRTDRSGPQTAPVFANVSLTLRRGEVLVIQGPSGAGKSVLLKCIANLLIYPSGQILYKSKTPEELGIPDWRVRILYLPQRPALLPGTPRELFETALSYQARRRFYAEKLVHGPLGRGHRDPYALASDWQVEHSRWDQTWNQLSGGEAQRIALAIGLALEPDVLLLDEPTSALDPVSTLAVEETLTKIRDGSSHITPALIWVTHSQEQADRVATDVYTMPSRRQNV